jgi:hypothetical protein
MPVKVNVKRFSRSKVNDEQPTEEPIEPVIEKKTRGHKKKKVTIEEPIIEEEVIIIEGEVNDESVNIDPNV